MHTLVLSLIIATLGIDYLAHEGWLPGLASFTQEGVALLASIYVVANGMRSRFQYVRTEYWIVFGALLVVIVCGILVNAVSSGPVFAGIRTYLRALPLFFLPAVFAIDDRRLRRQLLLVLGFALLQAPLAWYQRSTVWAEGHISGDWVVGTLTSSGILSVFLICVACVLAGFYVRKRLPARWFIPLVLIVLIPTALNETKATLFLLPLGLLTTFIVGSPASTRFRNGLVATVVLSLFGAIFVPIYDYYVTPRWGYGIVEFFTMKGRLEGYMEKRNAGIGSEEAGRVDAITVPVKTLARDPGQFVFGLGIGNASDSALGPQFTGEYFRRFEPFRQSTASVLILETGVLGLALVMLLYLMIFRDARFVARHDSGLGGAMAAGWTGAVAVIVVATFYVEMMAYGSTSFLFWYFSGLLAAHRMRLAAPATQRRAVPLVAAAR